MSHNFKFRKYLEQLFTVSPVQFIALHVLVANLKQMIKEFKPALLFLGKFLLIYFIGNLIYGFFIASFHTIPDPVTKFVTHQSSQLLDMVGYNSATENHPSEAKVMLKNEGLVVVNVFEGCNGVNVMIVFIAFLVAFGGPPRALVPFAIAGIILIHLFNLGRVAYLFFLALSNSRSFYYYHKYFFTATLYGVVFLLWAVWVIKFSKGQRHADSK